MDSYVVQGTRQTLAGWGWTLLMFGALSYRFGVVDGFAYAGAFVVLCVTVQWWSESRKLRRGSFRRGVMVALAMRKPSRPVYAYPHEIGPKDANGFFYRNL